MSLIDIVLLALALSIDAFVVSFAYGLAFEKNRVKNSLLLASFTGGFQGLMPIIGFYFIFLISDFIAPISKILVFSIFLILGLNFIKDGFENDKEFPNCLSLKCLFTLGIATSIDALAAGMTIALSHSNLWFAAITITTITFVNALIGFFLGGCLKHLPTEYLKIFAGVILIVLALKSLF